MLNRIFPKQFDNTYCGHWLAIWIFVPVVLVKLIMGVNVAGLDPLISNVDIVKSADRVPLDSFGAEAASLVVFLFASWALGLLLFSLLALLALIRYRAMIPLMYLVLSIEQIGRKGLLLINPIIRVREPIVKAVETGGISIGALINWGLTAGLVVGFLLSLRERANAR
jgi:hypothetical protein